MVDRITPNIWTDYPKIPLPQVLSFIVDNRGKTVPTTETGHKLIATNCIRNENLYPSYEKIRFLSDDTYRNWFRAHPVPGDIIFVCKGTPGRVCMVPDPIDFCIAQDMVALRANEDIVYNRYLLVILRSAEIQKQIYNYSVGDVIPHFKKSFFDRLEIPIPPMKIQRAIGDFYFSFSLKIELNTQINHNLEEQAKAIFKSWFIDFEPFRDGEFVDSELGQIPAGWQVGTLKDMLEVRYGKEHKKLADGAIPVYGSGGLMRHVEKALYNGESVLIPRKGSLNNVMRVTGEFWTVDTMFYSVPRKTGAAKYLYHILSKQDLTSMNSGSAVPSMTTDILNAIKIILPPDKVLKDFDYLTSFFWESIETKKMEMQKLAQLRDALLPELMSGEIDVSKVQV